MRAAPVLLLLLLAAPVADAAWYWVNYREMDEPGWHVERFRLDNPNATRLWISFDVVSEGEITGHLVALYDDANTLIRGATFFSEGGQTIEATLSEGDVRVTNDGIHETASSGRFLGNVFWTCDAECNPTRTFKLVIATGGDLDTWRYAVMANGSGITRLDHRSGPDAWAYTTRHFEGDVLHVQTPVRGLHKVDGASLALHADDLALATFVKPDPSPDPAIMRVEGAVDQVCPCFAGDWPAGDYTFRYTDQDINGVEGLLVFADVDLG